VNTSQAITRPGLLFIRSLFDAGDQLQIVFLDHANHRARQVFIAAYDIGNWWWELAAVNRKLFSVYVGANPVENKERGKVIRTVHLAICHEDNLQKIKAELPLASFILCTTGRALPAKYEIVWHVEGFSENGREKLRNDLIARYGGVEGLADVFHVPGFHNLAHEGAPIVEIVSPNENTGLTYTAKDFSQAAEAAR
jgi:hypothetical protein